jgi:nucleotide-binding universal stress UspA family protein
MIRRILVPLDGSAFAEEALPMALALARRERAGVELVSVHDPLAPYPVPGIPRSDPRFDAEIRRREIGYLNGIADSVRGAVPSSVTATVIEGPVVTTLADRVADGVDFVVMTTHRRRGLSRSWLGSVADGVVRRVNVPVLLIRPRENADQATDPLFARVLIPLDTSSFSGEVIEQAIVLGGQSARYTLLTVAPLLVTEVIVGKIADGVRAEAEAERAQAEAYLAGLAESLRARGFEVDTRTLIHHQPARAIIDYAEANRMEVIALATHGRGAAGRFLVGSVADKVLRGATTPVLMYRPTKTTASFTGALADVSEPREHRGAQSEASV